MSFVLDSTIANGEQNFGADRYQRQANLCKITFENWLNVLIFKVFLNQAVKVKNLK